MQRSGHDKEDSECGPASFQRHVALIGPADPEVACVRTPQMPGTWNPCRFSSETWPNPPWRLLTWVSASLMVVLPLVFDPFCKTLFLGLHLLFSPVELGPKPPSA